MFGLDEKALSGIRGVFQHHPEVREAKIFGSRALESHRPNSDVDLALFGDVDWGLGAKIQSELNTLTTPYKFDVVSYSHIEHEKLKDHIDRFGKIMYRRGQTATAGK